LVIGYWLLVIGEKMMDRLLFSPCTPTPPNKFKPPKRKMSGGLALGKNRLYIHKLINSFGKNNLGAINI
jgi:hypothetical protein